MPQTRPIVPVEPVFIFSLSASGNPAQGRDRGEEESRGGTEGRSEAEENRGGKETAPGGDEERRTGEEAEREGREGTGGGGEWPLFTNLESQ